MRVSFSGFELADLASQHPEILQKLLTDYDKFVKDVGVIVPLEALKPSKR
jgi:hypothetical protein